MYQSLIKIDQKRNNQYYANCEINYNGEIKYIYILLTDKSSQACAFLFDGLIMQLQSFDS